MLKKFQDYLRDMVENYNFNKYYNLRFNEDGVLVFSDYMANDDLAKVKIETGDMCGATIPVYQFLMLNLDDITHDDVGVSLVSRVDGIEVRVTYEFCDFAYDPDAERGVKLASFPASFLHKMMLGRVHVLDYQKIGIAPDGVVCLDTLYDGEPFCSYDHSDDFSEVSHFRPLDPLWCLLGFAQDDDSIITVYQDDGIRKSVIGTDVVSVYGTVYPGNPRTSIERMNEMVSKGKFVPIDYRVISYLDEFDSGNELFYMMVYPDHILIECASGNYDTSFPVPCECDVESYLSCSMDRMKIQMLKEGIRYATNTIGVCNDPYTYLW